MSKNNKVNKSNYDQGGRLTSDELARELKKQHDLSPHTHGKERITAKVPPANDAQGGTRTRNESEE